MDAWFKADVWKLQFFEPGCSSESHFSGEELSRESMRSDLFEFEMACSENKLEVRQLVSFSGAGCEPST